MSKRPPLYVIEGGLAQEQGKFYRLRGARAQHAPVEEVWPKDGEWRQLIRRLMRSPVKP